VAPVAANLTALEHEHYSFYSPGWSNNTTIRASLRTTMIIMLLFILSVSLAFIYYLFIDIWSMWRATQSAKPNQYTQSSKQSDGTFVYRPVPKHPNELGEVHVQWIARALNLWDCMWYFCLVTVNFQLNNLYRLVELLWRMPSPETNSKLTHSDVYSVIMDTGVHMWISPSDENLHFENVMLPVGQNGWCGGTGSRTFHKIYCELDHETCATVKLTMDDLTSTDPMEICTVISVIAGCKCHAQVHLWGAETGLLKNYPLANKFGVAMCGLNYAVAEDLATRKLLIGPMAREILGHNILLGTPHFSRGMEPKCLGDLGRSGLYLAVKAAHSDPTFQKYFKHPSEFAVITMLLLVHPVEHFVVGNRVPRYLESKLLDSNFTWLRIFAAECNDDFVGAGYARPWDDVGEAAVALLKKYAPHLAAGFRAIPHN
jgi:hypothetical protein